jgi:hypothetical protein
MGFIQDLHLRQCQHAGQGLPVYWHGAQRGGKGFRTASRETLAGIPMRWPEQYHSPNGSADRCQVGIRRGGHRSGIDIACVRSDNCLGNRTSSVGTLEIRRDRGT